MKFYLNSPLTLELMLFQLTAVKRFSCEKDFISFPGKCKFPLHADILLQNDSQQLFETVS